jgi:hypothetical protein
VKATGEISVEDLIEQEMKIIHDLDFEKGFNTYADFSKAMPSSAVNFDEIINSVDFVRSIQEVRGICKWAIFAPYDRTYTVSNMFAVLSEGLNIETKIFKDEIEAKNWLGI